VKAPNQLNNSDTSNIVRVDKGRSWRHRTPTFKQGSHSNDDDAIKYRSFQHCK